MEQGMGDWKEVGQAKCACMLSLTHTHTQTHAHGGGEPLLARLSPFPLEWMIREVTWLLVPRRATQAVLTPGSDLAYLFLFPSPAPPPWHRHRCHFQFPN